MNKPSLLATLLAFSLITSCGGGSSDDPTNNIQADDTNMDDRSTDNVSDVSEVTIQRVSLTGLAIKGILKNATVTALSLDGESQFGQVSTDDQGQYSLSDIDVPADTPVLLELTTNTDTTTICDSAFGCNHNGQDYAFGDSYPFNDPAFKLTAVLPSAVAANEKLMVTPVTHIAAQRAINSDAQTPADVAGINKATAKILGLDNVDINRTSPADITNPSAATATDTAQKYGAIVAAIATTASARKASVTNIINDLSTAYQKQGGLVANSSKNNQVDLADIFSNATATVQKAADSGIDLGSTKVELLDKELEAKTSEPDELTEAVATPIPTAKDQNKQQAITHAVTLLESIKTWKDAVSNQNNQELLSNYQKELKANETLIRGFTTTSVAVQDFTNMFINADNCDISTITCSNNQMGSQLALLQQMIQLIDYGHFIHRNQAQLSSVISDANGVKTLLLSDAVKKGYKNKYLTEKLTNNADLKAEINDNNIRFLTTGTPQFSISAATVMPAAITGKTLSSSIRDVTAADSRNHYTLTADIAVEFDSVEDAQRYNTSPSQEYQLPAKSRKIIANLSSTSGLKSNTIQREITSKLELLPKIVAKNIRQTQIKATATVKLITAVEDITGALSVNGFRSDIVSGGNILKTIITPLSFVFNGNANLINTSNDKVQFNGTVTISRQTNNAPLDNRVSLNGNLSLTQSNGNKLYFSGIGAVTSSRVKVDNRIVFISGDPVLFPHSTEVAGNLELSTAVTSDKTKVSFIRDTKLHKVNFTAVKPGETAADYIKRQTVDESFAPVVSLISANADLEGLEQTRITVIFDQYDRNNQKLKANIRFGDRRIELRTDSKKLKDQPDETSLMLADDKTKIIVSLTCSDKKVELIASLPECSSQDFDFQGTIYSANMNIGRVENRKGVITFVFDNGLTVVPNIF